MNMLIKRNINTVLGDCLRSIANKETMDIKETAKNMGKAKAYVVMAEKEMSTAAVSPSAFFCFFKRIIRYKKKRKCIQQRLPGYTCGGRV